jgi:hypothetical protein
MRAAQGGLTNNNLPLGASPPHKPDSPSIQPRRHVKPSQAGWPGQGKGQGKFSPRSIRGDWKPRCFRYKMPSPWSQILFSVKETSFFCHVPYTFPTTTIMLALRIVSTSFSLTFSSIHV